MMILLLAGSALAAPPAKVDFSREVRPILSGKCLMCHGPDDAARKAGLRLDTREGALLKLKSGLAAVVPGDPAKSELIARLHDEGSGVMPPAKVGKRLTAAEIDVLTRWVRQGADYAAHWAYVTPVRPAVPVFGASARNPIDAFVLARLAKEKLSPTPEADRDALLRRVTLDLTGLPPTPEEAEAFRRDRSPMAYERVVDRLLASPAYGERWATPWLDLARYADSQGYANDPDRTIWRWRDWVVEALNANMRYDEFTTRQLAGDLLPGASNDALIATGFHRNTLVNTEGGTNAEEFRSAAVVDRVNTTMQVWMGTTMACAQCHNHKYDPFSQKEYFRLYAILNNSEDRNSGDDFPTLTVAAVGREAEYEAAGKAAAALKVKLAEETKKLDATRPEWEKTVDVAKLPADVAAAWKIDAKKRNGQQKKKIDDFFHSQSAEWKKLDAEAKAAEAAVKKLGTTTPILREGKPRVTHVQIRGNFMDLGEKVEVGLPAALHKPAPGKLDRLALARWITSPENPLTARVAVNRLWEELFGTGIVETSEEFGLQGDAPSHPELLDWLATEYVRTGWDTKAMIRLLVTSATYRQGTQASAELNKRDPFNRLLARGPRLRMSAETIRDQALFAGGVLSRTMFGPPVQPPRPNFGLSAAFGSSTDWQPSAGDDARRRGLYTRWRRNAPYPSATTFDAPERTTCNVRRIRTNTPLQALVTLNDPVFVEAAQGLGRRAEAHKGALREKIDFAFRVCLTRAPKDVEVTRLEALWKQVRAEMAANKAKAAELATQPIGPLPAGADAADLAAWTVVGNVLLNLDETLARR